MYAIRSYYALIEAFCDVAHVTPATETVVIPAEAAVEDAACRRDKSLLVVEDNAINMTVMRGVLGKLGYTQIV